MKKLTNNSKLNEKLDSLSTFENQLLDALSLGDDTFSRKAFRIQRANEWIDLELNVIANSFYPLCRI